MHGVRVWLGQNCRPVAWGGIERGRHWMHFPGLASYRFDRAARTVTAFPCEGARRAEVRDTYRRAVLPMALQVRGSEVLHASGVLTPEGVALFCAPSGAGKSTVACALSQRGYPLWADDAVAFDALGRNPSALPLPFALRLTPQVAAHLGVGRGRDGTWRSPNGTAPPGELPAPLAAVFILKRVPSRGAGRIAARRFPPARAFLALLEHAYCFRLEDQWRTQRMMRQYLRLTASVPTFEVRFPSRLTRLPHLLDRIERVLAVNSA